MMNHETNPLCKSIILVKVLLTARYKFGQYKQEALHNILISMTSRLKVDHIVTYSSFQHFRTFVYEFSRQLDFFIIALD